MIVRRQTDADDDDMHHFIANIYLNPNPIFNFFPRKFFHFLTIERPPQVDHADLRITVHCRDRRVERLLRQAEEGNTEKLVVPLKGERLRVTVEDDSQPIAGLVPRRIGQPWIRPRTVPAMDQAVLHQVPAPGVDVAAYEGDIAGGLEGGLLGGHPDDGHRAQGALPADLPAVAAGGEAQFAAGGVGA